MFDPFGDFETAGYLRNVYEYKDKRRVSAAERLEVQSNILEAADFLHKVRGGLRYSHVLKVHKTLFGGLYPWAGNDRAVTAPNLRISKAGLDDLFALPGQERRAMEYALDQAANPSTMRNKPGWIMGLIAYSHPFLDGNGRTIMLLHQELCFRSGFHIDWLKTDKSAYLQSLTKELQDPGKGILDAYLKPFVVDRKLGLRESVVDQLALPGLNREP
ncbi:Adenosine monophosphate-protein transferase VbhT [compost metagenome]